MFDYALNSLPCIQKVNQALTDNEGEQQSMRQVSVYDASEQGGNRLHKVQNTRSQFLSGHNKRLLYDVGGS